MSQARRTWEVVYRAVITSLQLLDDYRTVMGDRKWEWTRSLTWSRLRQLIDLSCRPHQTRTRVHSTISIGAVHEKRKYCLIFIKEQVKGHSMIAGSVRSLEKQKVKWWQWSQIATRREYYNLVSPRFFSQFYHVPHWRWNKYSRVHCANEHVRPITIQWGNNTITVLHIPFEKKQR